MFVMNSYRIYKSVYWLLKLKYLDIHRKNLIIYFYLSEKLVLN